MLLHIGKEPWLRASAYYIRMSVFVIERSITLIDEFDANDTDDTTYAVLFINQLPVATGRLLEEDSTTCRLTRIATLSDHRGKHYGAQIIASLEKQAQSEGYKQAIIHSELTAVPFYKKQGYSPVSEIYQEDGVDCQTLYKTF